MSSETKHVQMNERQQKELDKVLRKIAQERKVAVEADLDSRLSYRDAEKKGDVSWGAYSRFLLSDGHTVYVNLRTMQASVSKTPDKFAQAKVEKRLAKQKKASERKAAKEAKAAEVKATVKPAEEPKPKAPKKARTIPVVKFDKDVPTLEGTADRQVKSKRVKS